MHACVCGRNERMYLSTQINACTCVCVWGVTAMYPFDHCSFCVVPCFFVSGSMNNATGSGSVVVGGSNNIVDAGSSAIVGGEANTARGMHGFIGGGHSNFASADDSTISCATVAGGHSNSAMGSYATVPGGLSNTASGHASVAMGQQAVAAADNSFTFSGKATRCGNNVEGSAKFCVSELYIEDVAVAQTLIDLQSQLNTITSNEATMQQTLTDLQNQIDAITSGSSFDPNKYVL